MPKVERQIIEQQLEVTLKDIRKKRKLVHDLKSTLGKHGIETGDSAYIIAGRKPLEEVSLTVICLLMVNLFALTKKEEVNPNTYFSELEIKAAKTFEIMHDETITLPYTFENVNLVKEGNYSTVITARQIKQLFDANILVYNFETQREPKIERDKDNQIVFKPKTNVKSVNEIAELLEAGELETSTITFNARIGTGVDGEECIYDPRSKTLTITKGTLIDILDGFHRISGINLAINKNPDLDAAFDLKILNYSSGRALKYFFQINKTNPIAKSRKTEANQSSMSTVVTEELKVKCGFLQGKVSISDKIASTADQLVTYNVLSQAIGEFYNPKNRLEALQTANYLAEFFQIVMLENPEAFITNISGIRKISLINANQMFYGYIVMSKYLRDHSIPLTTIPRILAAIDFHRENPKWEELGILNKDKQIVSTFKRKIRDYFTNVIKNEVSSHVI